MTGAPAKSTRADDRDAPVTTVVESRVKALRAMLVTVETDAHAAINQVLQDAGMHVVGLVGEAFCVVMPHS